MQTQIKESHTKGQSVTPKKPADYASSQEVRWCPGCGDYAILKTMQRYFAEENLSADDAVFVSGIGCSSRFPYYMNTYGLHTIHGRAPTFATGLKIANPDVDVWVITGDGDGMAIGAGHMLHLLRRNINMQVLLFNNRIYGLTKGQVSPTSLEGLKTPSTPNGSIEQAIDPSVFAIASGASFVARAIDVQHKNLIDVIKQAHQYQGASFIEIWQNCIIYHHEAFASVTDAADAKDRQIFVEHGKPMLFGKTQDKGIVFDARAFTLKAVDLNKEPHLQREIVTYDETNQALALMVAQFSFPTFPTAFGVLYRDAEERPYVIKKNTHADNREQALQQAMTGDSAWHVD